MAYYSAVAHGAMIRPASDLEGRIAVRAGAASPDGEWRMGKVIEFLARVGSDASLRHGSTDDIDAASRDAGVDDDLREAFHAKDGDAVRMLLGQRVFFSTQMPIGPDKEKEDPVDGEDEDGDGEPDGTVAHMPPTGTHR
ncbi:hypothetical protein [Luteibacter yeojuensis]